MKKIKNTNAPEFISHPIAAQDEPEATEAVMNGEPRSESAPEAEPLEGEKVGESEARGDESDAFLSADEQRLFSEDAETELERPEKQWTSPRRVDSAGRGIWVLLGVLAVLALVGAGLFFWFQNANGKSRATKDYQGTITSLWTDRVDESKKIKAAVETIVDLKGISGLQVLLNTEKESLGSEIPRLSTMSVPADYSVDQSDLVEFLIDYKDYLSTVLTILSTSDVASITARQLTDMVSTGQEVGREAGLIRLNSDFIRQDMNTAVFEVMPQNLKRMIEDAKALILGKTAQDEADKLAKQKDLQDVQDTVEAFLQAYIELDIDAAQALLTDSAGRTYELFAMGSDAIVDFLVVSTVEKEDYYIIVVKVTREVAQPPISGAITEVTFDRVTSSQEFQVIKESDAWKIRYVEFLEQD